MRRDTFRVAAVMLAAFMFAASDVHAGFLTVTAKAGDRPNGYVDDNTGSGPGASVSAMYDVPGGLPYTLHAESLAFSGTDALGLSNFGLRAIGDYAGPDNLNASQAYSSLVVNDTLTVLLPDVGTTVLATVYVQIDGTLTSANTANGASFGAIGNYRMPSEVYTGNETPGGAGPFSDLFEIPIEFTGSEGVYTAVFSFFAEASAGARETERVDADFSQTLTILGIDYEDLDGNPLTGTTQSELGLNYNGPQNASVPAPGSMMLVATSLPGFLLALRRRRKQRP